MLAARKLLLADDSITIQKIVALTFADEGIEVIAVGDGAEAIEKLNETSPDVVLADVFMPARTGYQVCEHIKQTERLKHIPVMLMVGSFEPFDEVEARRVGADDILTKPFQSIRTLMDKVGALLGRAPAADHAEEVSLGAPEVSPVEEVPTIMAQASEGEPVIESPPAKVSQEATTQELPPPEVVQPPEEPMTTEELEITTADTLPLSRDIRDQLEHFESEKVHLTESVLETDIMHTDFNTAVNREPSESFGESLLDLAQFEPSSFDADDDVVLDIDFDVVPLEAPSAVPAYTQTGVAVDSAFESPGYDSAFARVVTESPEQFTERSFNTSELEVVEAASVEEEVVSPVVSAENRGVAAPAGQITLAQLSPEVIDAIARRVVEQVSEKIVQEIAWEVVPQLAELMIKRRLEEQEAQNK